MEKVFEGFEFERVVDQNTIEKYQGLLPEVIINVWEERGYGTLLDGYLRFIDPDKYREILDDTYFNAKNSIPIMTTAFADIITWQDGGYIGIVQYRFNDFDILAASFRHFFPTMLPNEGYRDNTLRWQPYPEALALHGKPAYDQCFMNIPLLCLGGDGSPEKMQKGDLLTHIQLITEFTGPIA